MSNFRLMIFLLTASSLEGRDIDRSFSKTDQEIDLYYGAAAEARGSVSQRKSLGNLEAKVEACREMEPSEAIPILGSMIVKLARKNIYQIPERVAVYDKARDLMLSIPGHARYYANEIKREQATVASLPANTGDRVGYDRNRAYHFETLQYMPSPETIRILGEFLSDEIDVQAPSKPTDDWGENPRPNCWSATATIMHIGLRDAPVEYQADWTKDDSALSQTRAWWEEVKAGKRKFSFQGQNVEYRFREDGSVISTWITPPPSLAGKETPASASGQKSDGRKHSSTLSGEVNRWLPAIVGFVLLAAGAIWFKAARKA